MKEKSSEILEFSEKEVKHLLKVLPTFKEMKKSQILYHNKHIKRAELEFERFLFHVDNVIEIIKRFPKLTQSDMDSMASSSQIIKDLTER